MRNELAFTHPSRAGIGDAIERATPLPGDDAEARAERKILRRLDIKEALKP